MAFSFKKLFSFILGRSDSPKEAEPTKRERLRKTAADEHAARHKAMMHKAQEDAKREKRASEETQTGLDALKKKVGLDVADALAAMKKKHAEELERIHLEAMSPEERFVRGLSKLTYGKDFGSTNPAKPAVYQVWYVPEAKELWITFHDNSGDAPRPGPTYKYWKITVHEAAAMFRASSKGIAIWDQYRVRGSRTAHRKHYALAG